MTVLRTPRRSLLKLILLTLNSTIGRFFSRWLQGFEGTEQ
jgi:hypothetical protein